MARTELIKLRVTAAEKAFLVTQAGGPRRLSAHLRDLALQDFSDTGLSEGVSTPRSPAEDQAHRESRSLPAAQTRGDDSSSGERESSKGGETCPRWYHHRSGTYCGSCKTVPK